MLYNTSCSSLTTIDRGRKTSKIPSRPSSRVHFTVLPYCVSWLYIFDIGYARPAESSTSSNKTILYDTRLLQSEIGTLKGEITDLQVKIKSLEDDIRQSTKSILESESRIRKPLSDLASFISVLEKRLKTIENIYNI
ncbi:hypothetical protein QTP88_022214 [Uroleucon formosanum]